MANQVPRPSASPFGTIRLRFRHIAAVLGVLLLITAALKAHGLALGPLSEDSFLSSPRLQVSAIEVEALLGFWLLVGWWQRGAWMASLGLFGAFAGLSLCLGLMGQRSCGCFCRVSVNPWLTFGVDVLALVALVLWRPPGSPEEGAAAKSRTLLRVVAGAVTCLVLIVGSFFLISSHQVHALARLRGEPITVEPAVSDMGDGLAGEERSFTIRITNHSDHQVRVVGGTASCSCFTTDDLPVTLLPGQSHPLTIRMVFRGQVGRFQRRFNLYTDDGQGTIVARYSGRLVEESSP